MPQIKTYGPQQVTNQVVQGARASNVDPGAFGGAITQGLENVVGTVDRIQQQERKRKAEDAQLKNNQATIDAKGALLQYQQFELNTLSNPDTGYNNLRGLDAYSQLEGTKSNLTDQQKSLAGGLSPNAAGQFNVLVDKNNLSTYGAMNNHAAKGQRVHEASLRQTGVNQALEGAATFHDQREAERDINGEVIAAAPLDVHYSTGLFDIREQSVNGELNVSLEEAIQDYSANFAKNVVMASGGSVGMQESLDYSESRGWLKNEPYMKAELQKEITTQIKVEEEHEKALYVQNVVSGYMSTKGHSPYTRGEALEAVDNDPRVVDDPKLLDDLRKQVTYMYDARDKADDEDYGDTFDYFANGIYDRRSLSNLIQSDPKGWDNLNAVDKRRLESGDFTKLNQTWWLQFNAMDKATQSRITNEEMASNLDPETMRVAKQKRQNAIDSPVEDEIGRTIRQRVTSEVNKIINKATTKGAKDRRILLEGHMYQQLDLARDRKGGALTTDEVGLLINELTQEALKEDAGIFFFDADVELGQKDAIDYDNFERTQRVLKSAGSFGNLSNILALEGVVNDMDEDATEQEILNEYENQIQSGEIVPDESTLQFNRPAELDAPTSTANDAVTFRQFGSILNEMNIESETTNVQQMQDLYDHLITAGFSPEQITRELMITSYKEATNGV